MATTVTITGTGTPIQSASRAGPGVLIESHGVKLQFDAGRGTVMRLASAGSNLLDLDALFVTHHHSDHIVGIPDLLMTRWLNDIERIGAPDLPIHVPAGPAADIVGSLLDSWRDEMEMRRQHSGRPNIASVDVRPFTPGKATSVAVATFGSVSVTAIAVAHSPVTNAVGYRVDTPDGSIAISGDTAPCDQIVEISRNADILIHETILASSLEGKVSDPQRLLDYHAEPRAVGEMAAAANVATLVLTHFVPAPSSDDEHDAFVHEVRTGGFRGEVVLAEDLATIHLG